jgi:hypothetical protein
MSNTPVNPPPQPGPPPIGPGAPPPNPPPQPAEVPALVTAFADGVVFRLNNFGALHCPFDKTQRTAIKAAIIAQWGESDR